MPSEIIQLPQNGGNQNGGMILPVANGGGLFGNREGYEQAMRDAHEDGTNIEKMSPAEHEAYMKGQRDAYGRNGAENRNQL